MATTGHLWHKAGGVNVIGVAKTKPTTLVTTLAPRPNRSGWACWPSGFLSTTLAAANGSGLKPWAPVARFIHGHWPLVVATPPLATTPMASGHYSRSRVVWSHKNFEALCDLCQMRYSLDFCFLHCVFIWVRLNLHSL